MKQHAQTPIANTSSKELVGSSQQQKLHWIKAAEDVQEKKKQDQNNTQKIEITTMTINKSQVTRKVEFNDVSSYVSG